MMKNIGGQVLISVAVLLLGLMIGVFIGRGMNVQTIDLIPANLNIVDGPLPNTAYRDETVGRVNINSASAEELTSVPGIGNVTAQRIVSYRQKYGKFYSVDELLKIKGIGEGVLEKIKPYVTVGG